MQANPYRLDQDSTLVAVIEMSQTSGSFAATVPGFERNPLKKLNADPDSVLRLLRRWRSEVIQAGREVRRIVVAYEAGRDGFWLARWLQARAFASIAFSLAVERLMLAELLEQDHRQQAGTGPAARGGVERPRSLAYRLAVAAGELLPHVLDHLPLPRHYLQRLDDILTQLAQPMTAAAVASGRRRLDHAFARQMLAKWLARRSFAHIRRHLGGPGRGLFGGDLVFRRHALEFLEGEFHLVVQAG